MAIEGIIFNSRRSGKATIYNFIMEGKSIECSEQEYPHIRKVLQELAGEFIDSESVFLADRTLEEVKRLDEKFDYFRP